jgi:hypothetical protein
MLQTEAHGCALVTTEFLQPLAMVISVSGVDSSI